MTRIRTQLLLGVCLLAALAARPAAQQPASTRPTADQPPVTFRVEINYVEVDAAVFDRQGRFVNDLTRDDFQVLEEGVRAGRLQLQPRQHPDRTRRAAAVRAQSHRAGRGVERHAVRGPRLRPRARRPADGRPSHAARPAGGAAVHRAGDGCQRRGRRRLHERPRRSRTGVHQQQAAARGQRGPLHGPQAALDHARAPGPVPASTEHPRRPEQRTGEPDRRSARSGTRPRRPGLARGAQEHQRIRRRDPRAAEGHRVPERGHRLRHLRLQQSRVHDHPGGHAGRHRVGHAGQREHLRDRPARPHRAGRRVDRGKRRVPERSRRATSARSRSRTNCGSRRSACAASPRTRAATPPSTATTSARPGSGSSPTTARITSSATTRRTRSATGDSAGSR